MNDSFTKPQKPYHKYKEKDEFAGEIIAQIFSAHEDFIIYRVIGSHAVVLYYDDENTEIRENLSKNAYHLHRLKSLICNDKEQKRFKSHIALFYKETVKGNLDDAKKICENVINEIDSFKHNFARIYYLISCFSVVLLLLILSCIQDNFVQSEYLTPYLKLLLFGSLGGFLSVLISIKKLKLDINFYNWSHSLYGIFRIVIAIISSIIAYLLIKSGILFSSFDNTNIHVIYLFAALAGFSETFIPNMLKKIEKDEDKK